MAGKVFNPGLLGFVEGESIWGYIEREGGLTNSVDHVILLHPNGNAEKFNTGLFRGSSVVYDGSTIVATKIPVPQSEKEGQTIGQIIRDLFAITARTLTIMVLTRQL